MGCTWICLCQELIWQIIEQIGMLGMAEPDCLLLSDVQPSKTPNCLRTAAELADHCLCFVAHAKGCGILETTNSFFGRAIALSRLYAAV